jgi:hypothetical protein
MNDSRLNPLEGLPMGLRRDIPESEIADVDTAKDHLVCMATQIQAMRHACALFDFCQLNLAELNQRHRELSDRLIHAMENHGPWDALQQIKAELNQNGEISSQFISWLAIVGRHIAITIFEFKESMVYTKTAIQRTKILKSRIQMRKLDAALALFNTHFPNAEDIRDAASHHVSYFATPNNRRFNAQKGPTSTGTPLNVDGGGLKSFTCTIAGTTLIYTGKGMTMTCDLAFMLAHLSEIKTAFFKACDAIGKAQ